MKLPAISFQLKALSGESCELIAAEHK